MSMPRFAEDETWVSVIVTDQGNGGAYCGKCGANMGYGLDPSCPNCKRKVVYESTWINPGGSDF